MKLWALLMPALLVLPIRNLAAAEASGPEATGAVAATIPDIRDLSDLNTLSPLRLTDDWTVRLALYDPVADAAGPWEYLLCLGTCAGHNPPLRIRGHGDPLGPGTYSIRRPGVNRVEDVHRSSDRAMSGDTALFAAVFVPGPLPILSNRIEFAVTEAMLRMREGPASQPMR